MAVLSPARRDCHHGRDVSIALTLDSVPPTIEPPQSPAVFAAASVLSSITIAGSMSFPPPQCLMHQPCPSLFGFTYHQFPGRFLSVTQNCPGDQPTISATVMLSC